MSNDGCTFCCDAGADFDYCRVCGRGEATPAPGPQPQAPILEAIRKAKGDYTGPEIERMILATHPPDCDCGKHADGVAPVRVDEALPVDDAQEVKRELKHAREALAMIDAMGRDGTKSSQELALMARSALRLDNIAAASRVSPAPVSLPDERKD